MLVCARVEKYIVDSARRTIRILRVVCTRASRFRGASLRGSSTDLFSYVEAAAALCVVTVTYSGTDAEASFLAVNVESPGIGYSA